MRRIILVVAIVCSVSSAHAETPKNWNLLERNYDGVIITVVQGLTKHACNFARDRALGLPATPDEVAAQAAQEQRSEDAMNAFFKDHPECEDILSVSDQTKTWNSAEKCAVIAPYTVTTRTQSISSVQSAEFFD